MTEIQQHVCQTGSCAIHCLSAGDPVHPTVVLLHGMKFQAATWQELGTLKSLAEAGFHALAIDMPGFGRSPACSADQDSILAQVIDRMARGSAVLIGPSMGGRIALEFTINQQDQVAALVLVGSVGVEENKSSLPTIRVPTLIIWGSDDQVSPLTNCDLLASSIAGAEKFIIAGAPHPCYLDNPEAFHAELLRFLATVRG